MIEYFLKTAHRDSIPTYGGQREKEDPFQDLFQGDGAGPAGWVGLSSMIRRHQRAQGHRAKVKICIRLSLLFLMSLLYVYYGELLEAAQISEEGSERVAERLQTLVNSYICGLELTGGGCNPSKFHWWPIGFKWKAGEYSYICADGVIIEIYLPGIDDAINNLDPNEAKERVGVFTVPDGPMKDHLEELRGKVEIWAKIFFCRYLHRIVVWKALLGKFGVQLRNLFQ